MAVFFVIDKLDDLEQLDDLDQLEQLDGSLGLKDIFDLEGGDTGGLWLSSGWLVKILGMLLRRAVLRWAVKHLDVLCDDLGLAAYLTVLLPCAGLELTLDVDLHALAHILLSPFG